MRFEIKTRDHVWEIYIHPFWALLILALIVLCLTAH